MEALYPSLCELYAAGKLREFKQVLRPTLAKSSSSAGGQGSSYQGSSSLSNSLSKSPRSFSNLPASASQHAPASVVNRRDIKGRTALHLVVSNLDAQSMTYLDALLACPNCQINLQDRESGWTALHKALYLGNLIAARKLMARSDCDLRIKDREGLTPFDLLNATVESTNPDLSQELAGRKELFTWGSNRNFNLGVHVDGDRPLPEKVKIKPKDGSKWSLLPVSPSYITIGRFSTAVLSDENSNNLRLCGYGTSGRMGSSGVKIAFEPLTEFPHKIKQVALGFDHTVLLTATGDIFTYGLNHYGQLGYIIEPTPGSKKNEEPMQLSPRKVLAFRKEPVSLIAASRYHTVAYTTSGFLYTWGANRGQLGYASDSLQTQPRIVSAVPAPVLQLAASDHATACLLDTGEVFVLFKNTHFKMVFNPSHFPAAMQVYRPPTEVARLQIVKIAGGGSDWIAVSKSGDVFQWSLDETVASATQAARSPIRLWDLRSKFTAVTDAAIHSSSIILCTRSGHVFVGQRKGEAAKGSELRSVVGRKNQWKFARVPFLQRVVQVATNGSQAFGAIRSDHRLPPISVPSSSLASDLLSILPHWKRSTEQAPPPPRTHAKSQDQSTEDDAIDASLEQDVEEAIRLCRIHEAWDDSWSAHQEGSDLYLDFGGTRLPVHTCIVGSRSPVLAETLTGASSTLRAQDGFVTFSKSHPLTGLLLVHYLYSDRFPCFWDPRIALRLRAVFPTIAVGIIRDELQRLAHLLHLPALARVCGALERIPIQATLSHDIRSLHHKQEFAGDTSISFADGSAHVHSVILRARSPFFAALFGNPVWTQQRRHHSAGASVPVDLQHLPSSLMNPVLEHIYSDDENALFLTQEYETVDARIDFVASIMATANELLLDRLKIVCAEALRPLVDLRTFSAILQEAHVHECPALATPCLAYATANIETMLEGGYLAELELPLLERLQEHIKARQVARLPYSRSPVRKDRLYQEHEEYISQLDLAPPPRALMRRQRVSTSPKLSPTSFSHSLYQSLPFVPSPALTPRAQAAETTAPPSPAPSAIADVTTADDGMFAMDDLDIGPSAETPAASVPAKSPVWQRTASDQSQLSPTSSRSIPSLRQIMSDAEGSSLKRPLMPPIAKTDTALKASSSSTDQPWRRSGTSTTQKAESFLSIQSQQGTPTTPVLARTPLRSVSSQSPRPQRQQTASPSSQQSPKPDAASGVGAPVISPTRSVPSSQASSSRRWVNYQSSSSFFTPAASTTTPGGSDGSFASIQSAQQTEGDALKQKSTRSLEDIQQEEEFERWFAEESKRYQASVEAESSMHGSEGNTRSRGRGRGRGRVGGGRGGKDAAGHHQGGRRGGKKSSDSPQKAQGTRGSQQQGSQQQPGQGQGSPAQRR